MNNKYITTQVTSYTTKLLRNRFGKGPESVSIYLCDRCIILHLKNFISPVEKFLLSQEEEQAFRYTRELIMKSMLPELNDFLVNQLQLDVIDLYYDWGLYNASGVIVGLLAPALEPAPVYKGKNELHDQIIEVTRDLQKPPAYIDSWWVNPKTLFIFRKGLTILLEKEFIGLGYEQMLRRVKGKLEKNMLEERVKIEEIFNKKYSDLYVDWSFENDHSIMIYRLRD